MSIALNQTDEQDQITRIVLCGSVDVCTAAELRTALLDALAGGKEIEIATGEATGFDVTAHQLLWAARRESRRAGLKLTLSGLQSGVWESSLAELGMEEAEGFS